MTTINNQDDFLNALSDNSNGEKQYAPKYWATSCCNCRHGLTS